MPSELSQLYSTGYSEEEWAEVSQELPTEDDAVLQKFLASRNALIAEEQKQRSDYAFRQSLSPIAKKACQIVSRIREEEEKQIWTPEVDERLAASAQFTVHPGMVFTHAKGIMETTKLWRIVSRMPKGALLHAHLDAMVEFDFVFDVLLKTPGMHILAPAVPLATPQALADSPVAFRYFKSPRTAGSPPWSGAYEPGTPVLLTQAADAFPGGGRPAFLAWLRSRVTLSQADSVEQHHGVDHVWRKFKDCFAVVGSMIHYEPVWRAFLRRLMEQLHADGVAWAELRFTWPLNYYREGEEVPEGDYTHMFTVIEEELAEFKRARPDFWGLRMIWTTIRALPTRQVVENMEHCITTKLAFPHLVAGYDLVGQEDEGRPLRSLLPELVWLKGQAAAAGVELPLFLHAGETLGDGTDADANLFDAVLLGARRLGHGFSLYKHPSLVTAVRERRVLVESCPISNEVLRLCGGVLSHPLPALLARGVACCLSNDDPAMLGHDAAGLTHDFWQALQGWANLGLAGLGSLAENSVRWAAFEDQDAGAWARDVKEASLGAGVKAARLREWRVRWEEFCLWVVTEFGEEYDVE